LLVRKAARCRHGLEARRNSFTGLAELNRRVQGGKSRSRMGNDSTNDAWLSQTADEPQGHDDNEPCVV